MASIENVRLQLFENDGHAAALVTYQLRGNAQDVQQQRRYSEVIELIGVDTLPGEDGQNDPIPGATLVADTIVFTNTAALARPSRVLPLPSSALDEDRAGGPFGGAIIMEDEIRARVTLKPVPGPSVFAESNLVKRGGDIVAIKPPLPV